MVLLSQIPLTIPSVLLYRYRSISPAKRANPPCRKRQTDILHAPPELPGYLSRNVPDDAHRCPTPRNAFAMEPVAYLCPAFRVNVVDAGTGLV